MALFDGFFDSYYDPETDAYDREYGADEFTEYFDQMIGSGVCIHKNPDSFKVRLEGGAAVVSPGYLFIQGYWLKNDADYSVELTGGGPFAIAAHLDLGKRLIDVLAMPVAESYPDCLILAIVNAADGTAEDTRYRTGICGVIDAPGALSEKIEYAINYIDNEAEARLNQIESDMAAQEKKIDKKIAEVEAEAIKMEPLPVGTIKFSASPNVGEKWLKCDGSFVSEAEYPELVEALRGLKGGLYDQKLLSTFVPSSDVQLGGFFEGYFWTFCKDEKKIYRISLEDGSVKGIDAVFPQNSYVYLWNTLSIAKVGSQNIVYLIDSRTCRKEIFGEYDAVTGCKLEMTYFCSGNFSVDQNTITFVEKTITGTPPEKFSTYGLSTVDSQERKFDYRPVVVYNSVPYAALEIGIWSSNYIPATTSVTGNTTLKRCLVWVNLSGNGQFVLHEIDTKNWTGGINQPVISSLYSGMDSSLADGTPMDPEKGGLMVSDLTAYTIKGDEKQRIGKIVVPTGTHEPNFKQLFSPVISDNYLVFSITKNESVVVDRYSMDLIWKNLTDDFGDWGENISSSRAVKDKLYMADCDLYALLTNKGIVFTRRPDDPKQYAFVSTREAFGAIHELSGPSRTVMFAYSETDRVLYVIWQNSSYRVNVGAIKVPEGFDPLNGASLPDLESSGIPAYIKAKEG